MSSTAGVIVPDWPAPANVQAYSTTRQGGVSVSPYTSLNLGDHVGDNPDAVQRNRQKIVEQLSAPSSPAWLQQVHGSHAYHLQNPLSAVVAADASYTHQAGLVCTVMTADCLPLLVCNRAGTVVAAIHAGWRGLADGVIEKTIVQLTSPVDELMVWLGPAIGPQEFEVGTEVREAFLHHDGQAETAFVQRDEQHWLADIYQLARQRLHRLGVQNIYGGDYCTFQQDELFYSYRRDGVTGRMASLIWLI